MPCTYFSTLLSTLPIFLFTIHCHVLFMSADLYITVGPLTVDYRVLFCVLFAKCVYRRVDYDTNFCARIST